MRNIELSFIDSKKKILEEISKSFPNGTVTDKGFHSKSNNENLSYEIIPFFANIHFVLFEGILGVDTNITVKPNEMKSMVLRFILESDITHGDYDTAIGEGQENGATLFNTYTEQKISLKKNTKIKWLAIHIPIDQWIEFTESKWEMLEDVIKNESPWMLFESMTPVFSKLIKDIFSYQKLDVGKKGLISAKSIELCTYFFLQLYKRNDDKEKYGIPDVELSQLFAIRDLLSQNLDSPPDIDSLSKDFAMSPTKLRANFKKVFGMPPYQFLLAERLNEAYRLLESSDRPLTDIAFSLGFNDQSHFTKSFKKTFNCLPSAIRS
ncbi:helix-turn-helix transcriptional regulator [Flammeovirga sp. OC4]|uniref:helix-turn-helix transcriptional regulator n=1 Tax=Flammeovirga sp. OC4 TaxID=1382345 RepID=UPI0005C7038A|nr:AraC family transcriptional regulator [Flammeovirga sp. OC4]